MNEKIYLYKMDRDALCQAESELFELLPEWRKVKARKMKAEDGKLQSIAAGRLLDLALADYLGQDVNEIDWCFLDNNALFNTYLHNNKDVCFFNISHSGDYVAVVVGDAPAGIDVEYKDDKLFKVTGRFFTSAENDYIVKDDVADDEKQCRFRDVWTMKEAFLKCVGTGINVSLKSFEGVVDQIENQIENQICYSLALYFQA